MSVDDLTRARLAFELRRALWLEKIERHDAIAAACMTALMAFCTGFAALHGSGWAATLSATIMTGFIIYADARWKASQRWHDAAAALDKAVGTVKCD